MNRPIGPTLKISASLLSLTISVVLGAYALGLLPNEDAIRLQARGWVVENLAIQIASLETRNDIASLKDVLDYIVRSDAQVKSLAVRNADGVLMAATPRHKEIWHEPPKGTLSQNDIRIPLTADGIPAGTIEIALAPLHAGNTLFGPIGSVLTFVVFLGGAGFVGYYFILKRALRELDPSGTIPERIKIAFDTLAEGVLIMDTDGYILLANRAFLQNIYGASGPLVGVAASALPWMPAGLANARQELPWQSVLNRRQSITGIPLNLRGSAGEMQRLIVNAARIIDNRGRARGVIATFDDVTALHQTNERLNSSIEQLRRSQATISAQNEKLKLLASCDPLTGCLNRRTFLEAAEQLLSTSKGGWHVSVLMIDADHFKSVNDRFGHATGDVVLIGLSEILRRFCGERGVVGRYGGEEFCVALTGLGSLEVEALADEIRQAVAASASWLPNGERVTISLGIAGAGGAPTTVVDLMQRADEALYVAKSTGRNRFVRWKTMEQSKLAEETERLRKASMRGFG